MDVHVLDLKGRPLWNLKMHASEESENQPSFLTSTSKDPLDSTWRVHMDKDQWVPDVSVDRCMACRASFSFWYRRHHCRRCGAVVCASCSSHETKFIGRDSTIPVSSDPVRVCDPCIRVIDETLAQRLNKRLGGKSPNVISSPSSEKITRPEPVDRSGRAVLSVGSYRAEIKESEGNRYIRDGDL